MTRDLSTDLRGPAPPDTAILPSVQSLGTDPLRGTRLPKRLAVIGDVHGNWEPLRRAISAAHAAAADLIACVGDIAGHPEATSRCVELLARTKAVTVRGNHDRWLLEAINTQPSVRDTLAPTTIAFLQSLPTTAQFDTENGLCILCHGVGQNDLGHFPVTFLRSFMSRQRRLARLPQDTGLIIHGHSHRSRVDIQNGVTIVSVGQLSGDAGTGCVMVTNGGRHVTPLAY